MKLANWIRTTGVVPVLIAALLSGLGLGGVGGAQWSAGTQVEAQNTQLRAQAEQWARIAKVQRLRADEQIAAMDAAIARLNAISQGREDDREALRKFAVQLDARLRDLGKRNPALRDLDLGADFLRHWNAANTGPGGAARADPAAPRAAAQPGAAVSAAPAREQREPARGAGPARPGSSPVPRLPQRERAPD